MIRASNWDREKTDASVPQFCRILTKDDLLQKKSHAEECGEDLGRVLVLTDRKVSDLNKQQLETYRRRYGVAPEFTRYMTKAASESRRAWLRWHETQFQPGGAQ
jgi:hypothetical protein